MKGSSVLIAWVLVIILVVSGISMVMLVAKPVLESASAAAALAQAEQAMSQLDDAIESVSREGIGSSRLVMVPPGNWRLVPEERMIEFRLDVSPLEPMVRRIRDNLILISGFDTNCSEGSFAGTPAWIMENGYLKVYLKKANGTIDTANSILALYSKPTRKLILPADTSIQIDENPATSSGSGLSEMRTGEFMPKCRAHFFINSTAGVSYDIFYTLYSAADFLVVEIKNIS